MYILSSTSPYKNTIIEIEKPIQILVSAEVLFSLIPLTACHEQNLLPPLGLHQSGENLFKSRILYKQRPTVVDLDQKTPAVTICIANPRSREKNFEEGL